MYGFLITDIRYLLLVVDNQIMHKHRVVPIFPKNIGRKKFLSILSIPVHNLN